MEIIIGKANIFVDVIVAFIFLIVAISLLRDIYNISKSRNWPGQFYKWLIMVLAIFVYSRPRGEIGSTVFERIIYLSAVAILLILAIYGFIKRQKQQITDNPKAKVKDLLIWMVVIIILLGLVILFLRYFSYLATL